MEKSVNNQIDFLDVTIIVENNSFIFDWFHKQTFSGRYLNFHSQHPSCQKRGTVLELIDKAFTLSHPKFHRKNFETVKKILMDNCYPIDFIFRNFHERLKWLFHKNNNLFHTQNDSKVKEREKYFTISFINGISDKFRWILKDYNTKISFFSINKLNNFIKVHKDILPRSSCSDVVYHIKCKNCDASYVGQTSRQLHTRITEHRNNINREHASVLTEHRIEFDHDFDWNNVTILDHESFLFKRLVSEMIFIKRQVNSLNLQTDTDGLSNTYCNIIDKLKKI